MFLETQSAVGSQSMKMWFTKLSAETSSTISSTKFDASTFTNLYVNCRQNFLTEDGKRGDVTDWVNNDELSGANVHWAPKT